jgi:hypothetical protein
MPFALYEGRHISRHTRVKVFVRYQCINAFVPADDRRRGKWIDLNVKWKSCLRIPTRKEISHLL